MRIYVIEHRRRHWKNGKRRWLWPRWKRAQGCVFDRTAAAREWLQEMRQDADRCDVYRIRRLRAI